MPASPDISPVRIAILGASGYTGAELLRLLVRHPGARIAALTAERQAGKPMAEVFPHLAHLGLPPLVKVEDVRWDGVDFVFCALPHGTTQEIIAALPGHLPVVDLSADFRLTDLDSYAEWYGHAHKAPDLQKQAVYGLTELNRQGIRSARLVANPGCYPTATLLPLLPLLLDGLVEAEDIIVDAKSGVSGAGRDAKQQNLFCEVAEGMHAYGVGRHRHMPEMEQELSLAAGRPVTIAFTPHLIPMNRGEFITTYVRLARGRSADDLRAALAERYRAEPFVKVLPAGVVPHTKHVRGSNELHLSVFADRLPGRAIVLSVLDNLVKGASGQAIQNMNLMLGHGETMGLEGIGLFP
ncbi:N-acetyl-gamma-glutamyl-phosphate reductase [Arenibaculum pallidiluteum]|uniref:N-acetyl-gamma-glutamyl-phosphate reductase n=1 Tax=Arenibaculum pallidiluteum TaxID=2812559 RepID=UPI001A97508F|nr:N-acetyl-gamma-glutamyl-phosphate reductase [Arenibaculum pallidiluteum]